MLVIKDQKDFNAFIRVTLEHLNKSTKRPHIQRRELEQAVSPALSKGKAHAVLSSELKKNNTSLLGQEIKEIKDLLLLNDAGNIHNKQNFLSDLENSISRNVRKNVDLSSYRNVSDFLKSIVQICQSDTISNLKVNSAPNPAWFSFEEDKNNNEEYFFSFDTPLGSLSITYRVLVLEENRTYSIEILNLHLTKVLHELVKDECKEICDSTDFFEVDNSTNALERSLSIIIDSIISDNFSFKRKIEPTHKEKAIALISELQSNLNH